MKQVLFISHSTNLRGAENVGLEAIRQLVNNGCDVTVVFPKKKKKSKETKQDFPSQLHSCKQMFLPYKAAGGSVLRMMFVWLYNLPTKLRLLRYIKLNNTTCVYSNTCITCIGIEVAKWAGIKHIWHFHEPVKHIFWQSWHKKLYNHWLSYSQNKVVFIANQQAREWREWIQTNFDYTVIYNPVKQIVINKQQKDDDEVVYGYLGSFDKKKNIDTLIESFLLLQTKYTKTKLIICGAKTEQEIKQKIVLTRGNSSVKILKATNEVEKFYSKIDVLVIPSLTEVMPLIAIEAFQSKVAVIQTKNSYINELYTDNQDCIFIEPQTNQIAQAMETCIDPKYRNQLAQNAFNKTIHYDFNEVFKNKIQKIIN